MAVYNKKIGERVFFYQYDGTITSDVIKEITDDVDTSGTKVRPFKLFTLENGQCVSSYDCVCPQSKVLSNYLKENKKYFDFEFRFLNFIKQNRFNISHQIIQNVLRKYIE